MRNTEIFDALDQVISKCPRDVIPIIGADINASHGIRTSAEWDRKTPHYLGPFGNSHTNLQGEMLSDVIAANELCIPTTFFCKKGYDTWLAEYSKDQNGKPAGYQIDQFLLTRKDLK